MKTIPKSRYLWALAVSAVILLCSLMTSITVKAASSYTITFKSISGESLSSSTIADGDAIGTFPSQDDLIAWIYDDCRLLDSTYIPTSDMTVYSVCEDDVTSFGTLDSGNIIWFIYNHKLYVTGEGDLTSTSRVATGVTKTYSVALDAIPTEKPSIMYSWMDERETGDEKNNGFGSYTTPSDMTEIASTSARSTQFTNDRRQWTSSNISTIVPWSGLASSITDVYISDDIALSGNFTYYFNLNSDYVDYTKVSDSAYSSLENIYLYADTSAVTSVSGMFAGIDTLENVYVREGEEFDLSSCTDMSGMFYGDSSYESADDNNIINCLTDTGNVINMRYMCFGCSSLEHPKLADLDTSSLQDATFMFAGCSKAGLVCDSSANDWNLAGWDMSNVVSTAGMFAGTDIDLSDDDPLGGYLSSGASVFFESTGAAVTGSTFNLNYWDLDNLVIAYYMFAQNGSLSNFTMTGSYPALEDTSCMLSYCGSLKTADFSGMEAPALAYTEAMFFNTGTDGFTCTFDGADITALTNADYMFYGSNASNIDFDNTSPALVSAVGMFGRCSSLEGFGSDALGEWTLPDLIYTQYMFYGDQKLRKLDVTGWEMSSVQNISYALAECTVLSSPDFSSWAVDDLLIMDCFAYGDGNIKTINLSSWDVSNLTSAFYAFADMPSLTSATLTGWNTPVLVVASGMFAYDTSLSSVNASSWTAPALNDASGFFYGDTSLSSVNIPKLIGSGAYDIAYFFTGCTALSKIDLSGWNTANVEYFQAVFDGDAGLESVSLGSNFSTTSGLCFGAMFRGCESMTDSSLASFVDKFSASSALDTYEMFKGTVNMASVDLSGTSFLTVSDMSGMFYGDNNLTVIKLPGSFSKGVSDMSVYGVHIFYCSQTTPTFLTITSTTVPSNLASYSWTEDHRTFMLKGTKTINGSEASSVTLTSTTDTAELELNATSTFYLNSTALPLTYTWAKGSTTISSATESAYTVSGSAPGTYTATATMAALTDADTVSDSFTVNYVAGVSGISASYDGDDIIVSKKYDKDDVEVTVTYNDGTTKTLKTSEFSVNSQKVEKKGTNKFYVYYTANGTTYSTSFTVDGYRVIGEIEAYYRGPDVEVGKTYSTSYIECIAYYEDDDDEEDGFSVTPTSVSSRYISSSGSNTFTAYYKDSSNDNNILSDSFTVTGYVEGEDSGEDTTGTNTNVSYITAVYLGPDVYVGNDYDKAYVAVTVHHTDGEADTVTTDFLVNGTTVTEAGENTFAARVYDTDGKSYTTKFTVNGISADGTGAVNVSSTGSGTKANVQTGDTSHIWIWVSMLAVSGIVIAVLLILRRRLYKGIDS